MSIVKFKKFGFMFFVLLLSATMLLTGCGTSQKESNAAEGTEKEEAAEEQKTDNGAPSRLIKHEMGETEIEGTPERIVVLEFSFLDALASLGVSPVGVADDDKADAIVEPIKGMIGEYTSVGTRKQPSLEVISSLQPDLIIADLQRHKDIYNDLQKIAPTIVLKSLESSYQDNIDSFVTIAEAINKKAEGEKRLADHQAKMEELKSKSVENKQTVLPAVVTNDLFNAHASQSYTGELLQLIGYENAIQQEEAYAKLNLEQLVEINPDILFVMASGEKTLIDEWKNNPLWNGLNAVKNGKVYTVDRNLWSKFRGLIAGEAIAEDAVKLISGNK